MSKSGHYEELIAPCGVYCKACPSYAISCNGCVSQDITQKRKSKWSCKIRVCCFEKNNFNFCYECEIFPCKDYRKKLSDSNKGDKKFNYRHELPNNLKRIKKIGKKEWFKEQKTRWECPKCGGIIKFYKYSCSECGYKKQI